MQNDTFVAIYKGKTLSVIPISAYFFRPAVFFATRFLARVGCVDR